MAAWNLLPSFPIDLESRMAESAWPLVIYTGLALLVVAAIFAGAARFVNTTKKGNVRFKWRSRAEQGRR